MIASFPDHCLLEPFYHVSHDHNGEVNSPVYTAIIW